MKTIKIRREKWVDELLLDRGKLGQFLQEK